MCALLGVCWRNGAQFLTICRQEMSSAVWQAFQAKTRQYQKNRCKTKRQVNQLADEIEGLWLTSTSGDEEDDEDGGAEEGEELAAEGSRQESMMSLAAEGNGSSVGGLHHEHLLAAATAAAIAAEVEAAETGSADVELVD